MKKILTSVICIVTLVLQGCATTVAQPKVSDKSGAQLDKVIAERLPLRTASPDYDAIPAQLQGAISINDYAGEAKVILKKMAIARGLKFSVRGPHPHMPLFVMVNVKNATLEEVLTDIGSQMGQRANVVLTSTAIEVHYRDQ